MLDDPGHEPDELDHPNVHIAALFDGASSSRARRSTPARPAGRSTSSAASAGCAPCSSDLAQRVSWGTGTIGRQISAILVYLSQRLDADAASPEGLRQFVADLTTVYGLWSMICGRGAASRAA